VKKNYRKGKYTSIALNPEMTRRIEKVLKKKRIKLSKYAQAVLNTALDNEELKQTVEFWSKLHDSSQYQRIKRLEGDIEKLKADSVTQKEISTMIEDSLQRELKGYRDIFEDVRRHRLTIKKIVKDYKKWLRE